MNCRVLRSRVPLGRVRPPWLTPAATSNTLLDGSPSHWKFDEVEGNTRVETGGTTAYDLLESATAGGVGSQAGLINNEAVLDPLNAEQLRIAAAQSVFEGAGDFTFIGWTTLEDFSSAVMLVGLRGINAGSSSWAMVTSGTDFRFQVSDGSAFTNIDWTTTPTNAGTRYFVCLVYDSAAQTIEISIDDGTRLTAAFTGTINSSGQKLTFSGRSDATALVADCKWDEGAFWPVVKSDADITAAFNSGSGLAHSSWQSSSSTFTATVASTTGGSAAAATATHAPPVFTATSASTAGGSAAAATGTTAVPVFTATVVATSGGSAATATATHVAPVFTATGVSTAGGGAATATAAYATAIFSATAAATAGGAASSATCSFVAPVFTATSASTMGGAASVAATTAAGPTFTATCAAAIAGSASTATATYATAGLPGPESRLVRGGGLRLTVGGGVRLMPGGSTRLVRSVRP